MANKLFDDNKIIKKTNQERKENIIKELDEVENNVIEEDILIDPIVESINKETILNTLSDELTKTMNNKQEIYTNAVKEFSKMPLSNDKSLNETKKIPVYNFVRKNGEAIIEQKLTQNNNIEQKVEIKDKTIISEKQIVLTEMIKKTKTLIIISEIEYNILTPIIKDENNENKKKNLENKQRILGEDIELNKKRLYFLEQMSKENG